MNINKRLKSAMFAGFLMMVGACNELAIRGVASVAPVTIPCIGTGTPFAGGDGSIATPYQVCSLAQFNNVRAYSTKNFIQVGDIDLGACEVYVPIPVFSGNYDGQSFQLQNLCHHQAADNLGLFVTASGTFKNITMTGVNIQGWSQIGSLVGVYTGESIINCSAAGALIGHGYIGGLVGQVTSATISDSSANVSVTTAGQLHAGGLIGQLGNNSFISNCSASGNVSNIGGLYTGGLIGDVGNSSPITDSKASGTVTGNGGIYVGGLIGQLGTDSSVTNCTTSGAVSATGGGPAGGLIGNVLANSPITNSSTSGNISSSGPVGGLIGTVTSSAPITSCSASGTVTANGGSQVGGLIGEINGTLTLSDSYTNGNIVATGAGDVGGLVGWSTGGATISNSFSTSSVSASLSLVVGGLIGYADINSHITDDFSTGAVTGGTDVGGLIGTLGHGSTVLRVFTSGPVTGTDYVAGIIGTTTSGAVTPSHVNYGYSSSAITTGGAHVDTVMNDIDVAHNTNEGLYFFNNITGFAGSDHQILTAIAFQTQASFTTIGAPQNFDFVTPAWAMSESGLPYQTPVQTWVCGVRATGIICQ